jgi:hypothetical protein
MLDYSHIQPILAPKEIIHKRSLDRVLLSGHVMLHKFSIQIPSYGYGSKPEPTSLPQ